MSFVISQRAGHPIHHGTVFVNGLILDLILRRLALTIHYDKFWVQLIVDLIRHSISACILERDYAVMTGVSASRGQRHGSVI